MEYAYGYSGRSTRGENVSGVLYGDSEESARFKLRRMGLHKPDLTLNVWATLNGLFQRGFAKTDLINFYETVADRLESGGDIHTGLIDAVDFVTDPRLQEAIRLMGYNLKEGQNLADAMQSAGFPDRDVHVVRSTLATGKLPRAMASMAAEIARVDELRQMVKEVMRTPLTIVVISYVLFYVTFVWIAPGMNKLFKNILGANGHPPAFAEMFYHFADLFNAHLVVSTVLYLLIPIPVLVLLRSSFLIRLVNRIPIVHKISERAEMSTLWTNFSILYEAGIDVKVSSLMLARSAGREHSRIWFEQLSRRLSQGQPLKDAITGPPSSRTEPESEFPPYIRRGVLAAESSGDIPRGTEKMAHKLAKDVKTLSKKLVALVDMLSKIMGGFIVMLFIMVVYYPIISMTLSQL